MTITIKPPHYGYDYPNDGVILPCKVVDKLVANNNETIQGIAFELDGGAPTTVQIPPTLEFGFDLSSGGLGAHQLSILVFDNVNGLTSQSFKFTAVTGIASPVTERQYMENAPDHTAQVTDLGATVVGIRVKHTYRIDVTPEYDGQILNVAVFSTFKTDKDFSQSTSVYVRQHTDPQLQSFSMQHLNETGRVILSILMWDPNDMDEGVQIEDVVAFQPESFPWAPSEQICPIEAEA
jgi:hypothetical protein